MVALKLLGQHDNTIISTSAEWKFFFFLYTQPDLAELNLSRDATTVHKRQASGDALFAHRVVVKNKFGPPFLFLLMLVYFAFCCGLLMETLDVSRIGIGVVSGCQVDPVGVPRLKVDGLPRKGNVPFFLAKTMVVVAAGAP